jgi:hypothetical protein
VGVPGGACTTCQGLSQCDKDAGVCVGNMGTGGGFGGGGGGIPGFDGGLPPYCDSQTPCGSGMCCDALLGLLGVCIGDGETCRFSFTGGTCNGSTGRCPP